MDKVGEILEKHTIVVLNQALKHGFAQIPRYILSDHKLTFGARLAYAVLLSYAWQKGSCYPGQERMSMDLGVTRRAISKYLAELKKFGYVSWKRMGLGKTNVYYILDYKPLKIEADENTGSHQDVTASSQTDVTHQSHKYKQNNKLRKNRNSSIGDFV